MKKKLSKAARKKDLTGVNLEADKKREAKLEKRVERLEQWCEMLAEDLNGLYQTIKAIQPKRGKGK